MDGTTRRRRATGASCALLVLVVVLAAGCADGDDAEQAVLESQTTMANRPDREDTPERESDTDAEDDGGSTTGDTSAPPDAVLGTGSAELPNVVLGVPDQTLPIRLDVTELRRNGSLVELSFVLTNEAPEDEPDSSGTTVDPGMPGSLAFDLNFRFTENPGVPQTSDEPSDISGVTLVASGTGAVHAPASDDQGRCLCTDGLTAQYVDPGDSMDFAATYRDIPADLTTIDLHVPGFPAITGVPVEQ